MPGVIDTNLLLYATNTDADQHAGARGFLLAAGTSGQQWYLTEGIVYEFLRVATHPRVFSPPLSWQEAMGVLEPFLESPRFQVLVAGDRHWTLLREILGELTHPAGNLLYDVRTVALMREHGIRRIYTVDTDFLQFSGIDTVNPLKG